MSYNFVVAVCARCPQEFRQWKKPRRQTLCTDCRFVLGDSVERDLYDARAA